MLRWPLSQEVSRFNAVGVCPTNEDSRRARNASTSLTRQALSNRFNLTGPCGGPGWRRVAFFDMSDPNQNCPAGLQLITSPRRMCRRNVVGPYRICKSTSFSVGGSSYNRVCGRIKGCQYRRTYGLSTYQTGYNSIEGTYLDGVSLTHGNPGTREHIWSFISAHNQIDTNPSNGYFCPVDSTGLPPFVGNDYFCDSGYSSSGYPSSTYYIDNLLWDGQGCADPLGRCQFNNPPWFTKTLPRPTSDDIEMRLCGYERHQFGDTLLLEIELYVH